MAAGSGHPSPRYAAPGTRRRKHHAHKGSVTGLGRCPRRVQGPSPEGQPSSKSRAAATLPGWGRGTGPGGCGVSGGGAGRPLPSETRTWASASRRGHAPHSATSPALPTPVPEFQKDRELLLRALRVRNSPRWAQRDSACLGRQPRAADAARRTAGAPQWRAWDWAERGRRAGLGWGPAGDWKEVRGVAAAPNKAPLGAPPPNVDSRPSPRSRPPHSGGASQGRASSAAGARALLGSGKSSPLPAPKARRPGRPAGQPHPATKAKRTRPRGDSLMSSAKKRVVPGARWNHSSASSPEGAQRAPKCSEVGNQLHRDSCFQEKGPG